MGALMNKLENYFCHIYNSPIPMVKHNPQASTLETGKDFCAIEHENFPSKTPHS